jgi:hypothetical protein
VEEIMSDTPETPEAAPEAEQLPTKGINVDRDPDVDVNPDPDLDPDLGHPGAIRHGDELPDMSGEGEPEVDNTLPEPEEA